MTDTIEQLLKQSRSQLHEVSDSPQLDAEVLLAAVLKKNRSYFRAFPESILKPAEFETFNTLLTQRMEGRPVAHILGQREFWSLSFMVNEHTLIPRPDTEILIEFILDHFQKESLNVADLGTGSGAIACALASENPQWSVTATDYSKDALKIAQQNASNLQLNTIRFQQGYWLEALAEHTFDLIVSNPPYIPADDAHLRQGDVRFEPVSALASGHDGLDDIRYLTTTAADYLKKNGWLVLEHGYDQKESVYQLFKAAGFQQITQKNDYAGNARMTAGCIQ